MTLRSSHHMLYQLSQPGAPTHFFTLNFKVTNFKTAIIEHYKLIKFCSHSETVPQLQMCSMHTPPPCYHRIKYLFCS